MLKENFEIIEKQAQEEHPILVRVRCLKEVAFLSFCKIPRRLFCFGDLGEWSFAISEDNRDELTLANLADSCRMKNREIYTSHYLSRLQLYSRFKRAVKDPIEGIKLYLEWYDGDLREAGNNPNTLFDIYSKDFILLFKALKFVYLKMPTIWGHQAAFLRREDEA